MAIKSSYVEHIYNAYNLYAATYSRCPSYKYGEALSALFTMHHLNATYPGFDKFRVLEILAGSSEHSKYIRDLDDASDELITSYNFLDSEKSANSDVVQGDALYTDFSKLNVNFVIGFFFSASSVLDLSGKHSSIHARSVLVDLFKNVYKNMPSVGAFSLDYANNGYNNALCAVKGETEDEFDVPFYHLLRKEYGLPSHGTCTVKVKRYSEYNRLTSENSDFFPEPIEISYEGKVVGYVEVENPMTQRYFSEPELVDIATEAGFNDIILLKNDYAENSFEVLPTILTLDADEEIDDDNLGLYVGNTIVAVKTK